jgi:CheY-like chemotaxis protein
VSKHKLLLADDSITIQKVVNLTFADEGIEVISVGDGNSAMEKFAEFTPDLVMADINMPGLNGYEICERIKGNEATRRIPVILLVGSFEPFDEQEAQRVGANDYLTKPFQSIRQLVSKVSDLLNSNAEDEEAAAPPSSFDDTFGGDENASESEPLGDAGMDDDMIQSYQGSSFQFDETHKFESSSEPETENYGKTQPLSDEELDEINSYPTQSPTEDFSEQEETFETETQEFAATDEIEPPAKTEEPETPPMPESASVLELDEMNLLELPPRPPFDIARRDAAMRKIRGEDDETPNNFEDNFIPAVETIDAPTETTETGEAETSQTDAAVSGSNLSPEIIDAIAAKVVEKISDKVIREIAWEVVPQMTDLIVKRLAEEKLKE